MRYENINFIINIIEKLLTKNVFTIDNIWKEKLKDIFNKSYFKDLIKKILFEYTNKTIYPKKEHIFDAFNLCKYDKLSVVIIGQDPYINEGEANGLAFSVNKNIKLPPSLRNIYKEIESDLGVKFNDTSGDLSYLAKQGVLLLNSILTVEAGLSGSHKNLGWEKFTNDIILHLCKNKKNIVYILWGNYAKNKCDFIDKSDNLILKSAHPSPLSSAKFFGNKHFSKTNEYLKLHHKDPIIWIK